MSEQSSTFGAIFRAKETERYLIKMVMRMWVGLLWVLGLGNLAAGVILALGPARFRSSPNYGVFDLLNLPDQIFPVVLAISGVLVLVSILWRRVLLSVIAHTMAFVALFWWGFLAFGFLVDGQSSTGSGTFYVLQLACIHIIVVVAKLRAWYIIDGSKSG